MSYALQVLSINSTKVYRLDFYSKIILENEVNDGPLRYYNMWPFMTSTQGIWYSMVTEHDGLCVALEICDSDFKIDKLHVELPYWVKEEKAQYELTPLIINKEFRFEFETILSRLVNTSPIRTIMLLARYQGLDKETVCGVLTLSEYFRLLDEGKILFNICYLIKG
jgi:hypothetical protein